MPDTFPNLEQRAVIESQERVVVVRAGPGSGKTRVFVEALKERLTTWESKRTGVAALSFTNVAKEEIDSRSAIRIAPPHFVGTLDSFIWRYIVQPFSHLVGVKRSGAVLLPAALSDTVYNPRVSIGGNADIALFCCHATSGEETRPGFQIRDPNYKRPIPYSNELAELVFARKKQEWGVSGRVTHSDCQLLASMILHDPTYGDRVRSLLVGRFPTLLIDEAQDTGWFQERVVLRLLQAISVSALIVGDPDQAIYEFAGANPAFFDELEEIDGAVGLPISISQRCSRAVAEVASKLTQSGQVVQTKPDAREGRAVLLSHDIGRVSDLSGCIPQFNLYLEGRGSAALLARKLSVAVALNGATGLKTYPCKSHAMRSIDRAVGHLLAGNPSYAVSAIYGIAGKLLLDVSTPTLEDLYSRGIERKQWRLIAFEILVEAAQVVEGESWNDWTERVKAKLILQAGREGIDRDDAVRRIGRKCRRDNIAGNRRRDVTAIAPDESVNGFQSVGTIHGVKGQEFEDVIMVCPKPHARNHPCPSGSWWSQDPTHLEEKRIAFVAATRAINTFVLCVHESTLEKLRDEQPEFVGLFDVP